MDFEIGELVEVSGTWRGYVLDMRTAFMGNYLTGLRAQYQYQVGLERMDRPRGWYRADLLRRVPPLEQLAEAAE